MLNENCRVKLLHDIRVPHKGVDIPLGTVGTVVYAYKSHGAYEVEFTKPFNAVVTVLPDEIEIVPVGKPTPTLVTGRGARTECKPDDTIIQFWDNDECSLEFADIGILGANNVMVVNATGSTLNESGLSVTHRILVTKDQIAQLMDWLERRFG